MTIKICYQFRILSWVFINWTTVNLCMTRIKFRIYKAAIQKKESSLHYSQMQLVTSPLIHLFVLQQIFVHDSFFKTHLNSLNDVHKIFFIKNLRNYKKLCERIIYGDALNQHKDSTQYLPEEFYNLYEKINSQVVLVLLEPEWLAYQHKNYMFFYDTISFQEFLYNFKINTAVKCSCKSFTKYINLLNYVSDWQPNFVFSRLSGNSSILNLIKKNGYLISI